EAHLRAEERLARLEEAQIRTENALQSSAAQVGRLSDVVGYSLEDLAREVTPAYLARHFGVDVPTLDRRFFTVDGEEIEIDFYGEGLRDGKPVAVVGEVRSCIYGRDVEAAVQIARRLIPLLPGPALPVLFGFVVHPSAREAAERTGAIVITSMGR
ncbi:MAG: hypothetical protein QN131_03175, partial [Armatimonadota bacterium]|nr:hypothetical protein [Armatimonadota bacterium]